MKTKITLLLMSLLLSAATSFAQTMASGTTGACTWTFAGSSGNYTLTISGNGAMADYSSLSTIPWYSYGSSIKTAIIEDGVTSIGNNAFSDCSNLTEVSIGNSVESIGEDAFSRCTHLTEVAIPNSVTSIGGGAFSFTSLTSVTIPNSVESIGKSTFYYCTSLTSVTIPNSVTSIGVQAFYECTGLTSVTIPNSVESIGVQAFFDCSSLASVTVPNSVTSIGNYAFSGCGSLTEVTILSSVAAIGYFAFKDCTSLTSFTILRPTPQSITSNVFTNVDLSTIILYVPSESIEAYRAASVWQDFGTIAACVSTAINAPAGENDLWIYPNPVRDSFRIRGLSSPALVAVTDISGKIVWKQTLTGSESIPASSWPAGVYLLRAQGQTVKVVKN